MHFCFEFQLFSAEINFNIKTLISFKQNVEEKSTHFTKSTPAGLNRLKSNVPTTFKLWSCTELFKCGLECLFD